MEYDLIYEDLEILFHFETMHVEDVHVWISLVKSCRLWHRQAMYDCMHSYLHE
jgi:hypothetical protein